MQVPPVRVFLIGWRRGQHTQAPNIVTGQTGARLPTIVTNRLIFEPEPDATLARRQRTEFVAAVTGQRPQLSYCGLIKAFHIDSRTVVLFHQNRSSGQKPSTGPRYSAL